tara:strand:+ start:2997 stop:4460 length:1464 start_codon:yes stop_codon:yes gene_type:complete
MNIIHKKNLNSNYFSFCEEFSTYPLLPSPPSFSETQTTDKSEFKSHARILGLGTITKFNSDFFTKKNKITEKRQSARAANFKLVETTKKLLANTAQNRICVCMSHRLSKDTNISIKHNGQIGSAGLAYYSNLIQCSSIHTCIFCNNRIMLKRSKEITQAYDYFTSSLYGFVPMLTLTIPHKLGGSLEKQLELINQAYKRLMDDRIMRQVWELVGKVGAIKGVEYTHGKNGHHNHIHSLMFLERSHHNIKLPIARWTTPKRKGMLRLLNEKQEKSYIDKGIQAQISYMSFEDFIKFYWVKLCRDVGLGMPSLENGAVITEGNNVKSYIAKHKSAQEITNSRDKKAKHGNRNQWELLLDYQNGDKHAGEIFKEYAQAFSGGKLLRWSNGLKKLLLIAEIEDEEVQGEDESTENETIEEITMDVWQLVKRYRLQARLLSAVENDRRGGTDEYRYIINRMISHHVERVKKEIAEQHEYLKNYIPPKFMIAS